MANAIQLATFEGAAVTAANPLPVTGGGAESVATVAALEAIQAIAEDVYNAAANADDVHIVDETGDDVLFDTAPFSTFWAQGLKPSFEVIGAVGGITPRITATMVRASDATQYAIGDNIGNSTTAASVVPIEFAVTRSGALGSNRSGRISGCRCVVSAASGTIVLPAFYLYIFRPETSIPFAAAGYPADNAALNISAAAQIELVGIFEFRVDDWTNQAGLATAAGSGIYQAVGLKPAAGSGRVRPFAPFNLAALGTNNLLGLMQVQNTWNPGAVANTFNFALDVEQN